VHCTLNLKRSAFDSLATSKLEPELEPKLEPKFEPRLAIILIMLAEGVCFNCVAISGPFLFLMLCLCLCLCLCL
jgi:hypothetical protein